ncbi:MAG TPA: amino acid permease [Ensifer sp.]|nr:amino acid permease [Ensifer sp.]
MSDAGIQYKQELSRTLSLIDLLLYGIVFMSPIAVFAVYGFVREASEGMVVLAYLIGCLAMVLTGLSYASMSKAVPIAGSVYHYARASMGQAFGFIAGWAILLDYILLPALMVLLGGVVMNSAIPAIPIQAWVLFFLTISTAVNFFGVRITTRADMVIASILMFVVLVFIVAALGALYGGAGSGSLTLAPLIPASGINWTLAVSGASVAVLTFLGFDAISTLAEEVSDGDTRKVGRAIILCLLVMGGLYVFVSWILTDLSTGLVIADASSAAFAIIDARLPWFSLIITVAVGLGTGLGSSIPPQAAVSRVLFAMARDRQLPAPLARVHSRYQTPYVAILFMAVVMAVILLGFVAHLDALLSLVNFGALVAFLFVNASVIMFHWVKNKSRKIVQHWLAPAAGFCVIAYVLSGLGASSVKLGLIWLAAGILYYLFLLFVLGRSGDLAIDTAGK